MFLKKLLIPFGVVALSLSSVIGVAHADNTLGEPAIRASVSQNLPRVGVNAVNETQIPGIYQVELTTGEWIHMSADGKYILTGDLLRLQSGGVENLTEVARGAKRVEALKSVKNKDMVVFKADGEQKGEVFVFTDPTCGYCIKFHHDVPELNKRGITVNYLAWPRAGLQSPAGQTMVNVWCNKDRQTAMTRAKNKQAVPRPEGECSTEQIQSQIQLGHQMGVRGTPALYLKDGRQIGGYLAPDAMQDALGL